MIGIERIKKILLLICFSVKVVHNSEIERDLIYINPLRVHQYPPQNVIQTYVYFPEDGHYEVVNYLKPSVPFQRFDQIKLSPLNVNKASSAGIYALPVQNRRNLNYNHPAPFKKPEVYNKSPLVVKSEAAKSNKAVSTLSEGGKKYEDSYLKKHGYKTNEAYNKGSKFDKGQKESYEKHQKSGDEKAEKGSKNSSHEDVEESEKDNKEEEKKHAEKYNSSKKHKKGSKSKGYHNIFMKDEYKKDHTFFDNSDEKGHYSKHGSDHTKYENDEHKSAKGSHKDSGSESSAKKKESLKEKKHYDDADVGYEKESKHKARYYDDKDHYLKNGKSIYNVAIKHV